jgi:hypothetical protein
MTSELLDRFRTAFFRRTQEPETCEALRNATLSGQLGRWTAALTTCVVAACGETGLRASAKAHASELLPIRRSEYLALDLMEAMDLGGRVRLDGRTIVVVGSRSDAEAFPFGFFSWWELETNTSRFIKF